MNPNDHPNVYSPPENSKETYAAPPGAPLEKERRVNKPSKPSKNSNHTLSSILKIANLGRKAATSAAAKQDSALALSIFREARTLTHDWLLIADEEVTRLEHVLGVPPEERNVPRGLKEASTLSMIGLLGVLAWKVVRSSGSERERRLSVWRDLRMVLREFVGDAEREIRHLERIVEGKHRRRKKKHGKEEEGGGQVLGETPGVQQPEGQPQPGVWPGQPPQIPPPLSSGQVVHGSQQPLPQPEEAPPFPLSQPGSQFPAHTYPQGEPLPSQAGAQAQVPPQNGDQLHWTPQTQAPNGQPMPPPKPGYTPQHMAQPSGSIRYEPRPHDWAQPPGAAQEYYNQQPPPQTRNMYNAGMAPPHSQQIPSHQQAPEIRVQPASRANSGDARSTADVSYISSRGTTSPETPMQMPQPRQPVPASTFRSPAPSERRTSRPSQASQRSATTQYGAPHLQNEHYQNPAERPESNHERSDPQPFAPSILPEPQYASSHPSRAWTDTIPIHGSRAESRTSRKPSGASRAPSTKAGSANAYPAHATEYPASAYSWQEAHVPAYPHEYTPSQVYNTDNTNGGAIPRHTSQRGPSRASSQSVPSVQTAFRAYHPQTDQTRFTPVPEEEPFSEIDMIGRKQERPKVCHHEPEDSVSRCNSPAYSCELMDDGVTFKENHVHSRSQCGSRF